LILKKSFDNYVLPEINRKDDRSAAVDANQSGVYEALRLTEKREGVTVSSFPNEIEVTIPKS
jgi:hypothetical protein